MSDSTFTWRIYGHSVRGSSHARANKPNQDAFLVVPDLGSESKLAIAAVADGHGNRKSFRSHKGAQFATEVAVEQLKVYGTWFDVAEPEEIGVRISELRQELQLELPQRLLVSWHERVSADLQIDPFSAADLLDLTETERTRVLAEPRTAYGTTILAAIMFTHCAVFIQLGDGDIVVVDNRTSEPSRPLPPDACSFANETASLASLEVSPSMRRPAAVPGPLANFRIQVVPFASEPPPLVLVTTDGYVNAFVTDAGFLQVAKDISGFGRTEGWEFVQRNLPEWLSEASSQGSGDDVTVVLLVRNSIDTPVKQHQFLETESADAAEVP